MFILRTGGYNEVTIGMDTIITTIVVQILFFSGIIILLVGIPYLIMQYFTLRRFDTSSLDYVLNNSVMTPNGLRLVDDISDINRNKIISAINKLDLGAPDKQVRSVVQKACRYIPKYKLAITSVIVSPAVYSLVMVLCIYFGDAYFLGFFILLGFVCIAPVIAGFILKHIKKRLPVVEAEIEERVLLIRNLMK